MINKEKMTVDSITTKEQAVDYLMKSVGIYFKSADSVKVSKHRDYSIGTTNQQNPPMRYFVGLTREEKINDTMESIEYYDSELEFYVNSFDEHGNLIKRISNDRIQHSTFVKINNEFKTCYCEINHYDKFGRFNKWTHETLYDDHGREVYQKSVDEDRKTTSITEHWLIYKNLTDEEVQKTKSLNKENKKVSQSYLNNPYIPDEEATDRDEQIINDYYLYQHFSVSTNNGTDVSEYNFMGNQTLNVYSDGRWVTWEYDDEGTCIRREESDGDFYRLIK